MSVRYYFNCEHDHAELDPDGIELPDIAAVRKEALRFLGEMLRDYDGDDLQHGKCWKIWVTDAPGGGGQVFFNLRLSASEANEPA